MSALSGDHGLGHVPLVAGPPTSGAEVAPPGVPTVLLEDGFDAVAIHAELTDELRRLVGILGEFGARFEAIRDRISSERELSQLVSIALVLTRLQLQDALLQGVDEGILLDDGAEYLRQLGLCLEDAFREVRLDGRDFVCIAKIDKRADGLGRPVDAADKQVDVHACTPEET